METDFSRGFTDKQKVTIIVVLKCLAEVDGVSNDSEMNQWIQICQILDVSFEQPKIQRLYAEILNIPFKEWMDILETLNKNQKEWIIISAISLAKTDGEIVQSEQNSINNLCEHFGISNEELENIIKKMIALQGMNRSRPIKVKNSGCLVVLILFIISLASIFLIV